MPRLLGAQLKNASATSNVTLSSVLVVALFLSLLVAGVPVGSSLLIVATVVVFALPWLFLQDLIGLWTKNYAARVTVAVGMGTISQALVFSFTPIVRNSGVFWAANAAIAGLWVAGRIVLKSRLATHLNTDTKLLAPILTACVSVLASAVLIRLASPISDGDLVALPGDYALFAEWGRLLSSGAGPTGIIEGFDFRYHWLVYAWLGGFDRILGQSYLFGPVLVAPALAWLGLSIGSVAIAKMLSRAAGPAVLAVLAVMFSSSVGLSPFSMAGLGGLSHSSPSHVVASLWLVAGFLIAYELLSNKTSVSLRSVIFLVLGFSLMLSKATTFLTLLVSLFIVSTVLQRRNERASYVNGATSSILATIPLLIGGTAAYFIFISGTGSGIAVDDRLIWTSDTSFSDFGVQLTPLAAYTFSVAVWVTPVFLLFRSRSRNEPVVLSAAGLSIVGIAVALILEMRGSNETWLLQGSLILILPVAAFAVARTGALTLAQCRRICLLWVLLPVAASLIAGSYALVMIRDSPRLLERPWLLPSVAIAAACLVAFFAVSMLKKYSTSDGIYEHKPLTVVAVAVSLLFLLSIAFGFTLRFHGGLESRAQESEYAGFVNGWLSSAQEQADSFQDVSGRGSVAVLSTSSGERILARWIPFLIQQPLYSMRTDDDVHLYFLPSSTEIGDTNDETSDSLMDQRESLISEYVLEGSLAACEQLRGDGVEFVWLTPNSDFSSETTVRDFSHSFQRLTC